MMRECPLCKNRDSEYFYLGSKGLYCRKCIRFKRVLIEEDLASIDYQINDEAYNYTYSFPLTKYQKIASHKCLSEIKRKNVLLHCVCGAGKTEIVVETMAHYLKDKRKICYAIARKEVVIELEKRFKILFPKAKVVSVYGGHHSELYGDIIVCTTHQLYRYPKTFDLLILDEVDAFPFKGDDVLFEIAKTSCIGHIIFSTATIDGRLIQELKEGKTSLVSLDLRPHLKPLIVPKLVCSIKAYLLVYLLILIRRSKRQMIVFVSSKQMAKNLCFVYKFFTSATYVYSDLKNRRKNIDDFKNKKVKVIFATTVLERGITIKGVSVVILNFHDGVFDEASLVQMLGRVGRDFNDPYGDAYILTNKRSRSIKKAINTIRKANDNALSILRQEISKN